MDSRPLGARVILGAFFGGLFDETRASASPGNTCKHRWGVVQLVGHLTVNEDGEGSNPSAPANFPLRKRLIKLNRLAVRIFRRAGLCLSDYSSFGETSCDC